MDLPKMSISIDDVSGVNASCQTDSDHSANTFSDLFHIVPSVGVGIGVFASGYVDVVEYTINDVSTFGALDTSLNSIATTCFGFDQAASTYGPASVLATATATTNGGSTGPSNKSGSATILNPIREMTSCVGRLKMVAGLLLYLSVYFVSF